MLFKYEALNDDELTMEVGQIINIISKEVEDKGWWKGELDGKVGVFPDNFVRLVPPSQVSHASKPKNEPVEEVLLTASGACLRLCLN